MRRVSLLLCVLVGKCGNCLGGCGEVCYIWLSVTGLGPWVYGLKFAKIPVRVLGKLCGDLGWGVKGSFLVLGTEYLGPGVRVWVKV